MKRIFALGVVCLALAGPAFADWNVGDPHKMHYPQLPDPNGWDVLATRPKILADDFRCSSTGPITDVHFWGSWQQDVIGQITGVHLSIHSDDPVGPGGSDPGNLYSKPDQLLWDWDTTDFTIRAVDPPSSQGWYDPNTGVWNKPDHTHYFQYNLYIPEPIAFHQQNGTIYWLDIQVQTQGGLWGWKTSMSPHFNDDAVWGDWDPLNPGVINWQELRDPVTTESLDLAFVITPEPGTLVLLLFGVTALMYRRR